MDDLANLVQDVKYEGELSDPRPKPMVGLPLLPEENVEARRTELQNAPKDKDSGLKPLQFENLMREYLGYYMIKDYLKSTDDESGCTSLKLDFIEQVDIFQACQNESQRGPIGTTIFNKFCKVHAGPMKRNSVVLKPNTVVDSGAEESKTGDAAASTSSKKNADSLLNGSDDVPLTEWRPEPSRIHVDPSKLKAAKSGYEKYGKDGDNIIKVNGSPIKNVQKALEGEGTIKLSIFGDLKYIVLHSILAEHYDNFLKSTWLDKYVRYKNVETHTFKEEDFGTFRVLGRGGFGLVNGAKCAYTGKLYAMKILDKKRVKQSSAEDLCWAERRALGKVRSPFVLNLKYAFQTDEALYLMLDLMTGGDLAFHLRKKRQFDHDLAVFYAASVLEALAHMHSKNIVYRDLKPANVLLDEFGFCALSDLGLAEVLSSRYDPPSTKGRCGTRGYWAPEMITKDADGRSQRYGVSVDWFSFGCFVYEMLYGKCPFRTSKAIAMDSAPEKAMDKATKEMEPDYPEKLFNPVAIDLISKLLKKDPKERIGCGEAGPAEIRNHPFFAKIDFGLLELRKFEPPWKPNAADINALSQDEIGAFEEVKEGLTKEEQAAWKKWDFTSKSVVQHEVVELLMWEDKVGPCAPVKADGEGCCTIL